MSAARTGRRSVSVLAHVGIWHVAAGRSSLWWVALGGWPFSVTATWYSSGLFMLGVPYQVMAVLVPFALFGWAFARGPLGRRIGLVVAGFVAAFAVVGTPTNLYWGTLCGVLLLPGLALARRGLLSIIAERTKEAAP